MRATFVPLLAVAFLLAGCNAPAEQETPQEVPDDEPGRTARGGGIGDDEVEEEDLQPVELLRTPLTMAGQGPESFEVTVPPGLVSVGFTFSGGTTFSVSGLRVELSDCGSYDSGTGFSGSTGSVQYSASLCDAPRPGPATVTISATLIIFDGTFILTGYAPMDEDEATAGNATVDG